ncbi:hypothetical protein Patl1_30046 [Pistacia atlantica]|uniref:Uncharacterized protein n=1 Tax=Pistacia atlantica TaxID=434234 RepID=A0ACC1AAM1_9ROSI|nr:hypothetical protein Patl1_30046 [Pistacia atlantica]
MVRGYEWISPDETEIIPCSEKEVEALSETHDLCVGSDCIEMLQQTSAVLRVIPYVKVFARVAPEQKELVMTTFKTVGRMTLMCGDGTNDVGALKQLNAVPPTQNKASSSETSKDENTKSGKSKKSKSASEAAGKPISQNGEGSSASHTTGNRYQAAVEMQRQKLMDEMNEEGDGRSAPIVKLVDASMAPSFTAKHASVAPTTDIIRQGRNTLVTTLQMFKILGLNCLATAYVLSVMYLDGVKLGDVQATISGVFTEAEKYMPDECIEPDSDFHPNLVNTVSYMVSMMLQVATFAVNYMGLITSDLFRDLNDWLKLVPLPRGLRDKLLIWASLMFLSCYSWEKFLRWAFPGRVADWKKRQSVVAANSDKKHV